MEDIRKEIAKNPEKARFLCLRAFFENMIGISVPEIEGLQLLYGALKDIDDIRPDSYEPSTLVVCRVGASIAVRLMNCLYRTYFHWNFSGGCTLGEMIQNIKNSESEIMEDIRQVKHIHRKDMQAKGASDEVWEFYAAGIWQGVEEMAEDFFAVKWFELVEKFRDVIAF